jgi:inositol hexakisphosphate/diphosphoinositol-pentakisphosphate kinase
LGLCCMDTKANGNPMKALLRRLEASGVFEVIIFGEECILTKPIEEWPKVECLIAFYSNGFPLEKAIEYVRLVKPIEINRLDKQRLLRDRLAMYETLRTYEIPCPDYIFVDHSKSGSQFVFEEADDYIMFNGRKLMKPFVEKPIDGDDHNIWIYYPPSVGGGCKKLIRKTDDKSSEFDPNCNKVRRDGAYLYEPFLPTQGLDVKVYMVGTGYSHAEARKAPTVDGRVMRSKDGKEIRYPIALSEFEKVCGALVVKAFSQYFCGFDVLRTKGGSVICDVNGWSFVKGNQRYYDDAALLLQRFFLDKINVKFPIVPSSAAATAIDTQELSSTYYEHGECEEDQLDQSSLRSVIVIMRHGDRRPKEKLKFKTSHPAILQYFSTKPGAAEVLMKHPDDMERLAATVKNILLEMKSSSSEEYEKFDTLRMVLELHESFEGVTRKVQLKPIEASGNNDGLPGRVLVVAKWGGELTETGRAQAEDLGRFLRQNLFPVSSADGADDSLLRLHSSFRHDFKIYSSIEGRCQTTAAAFTKGFLDLEGDLTPILVSLVCYDDFARALLDEPIPKQDRDKVKARIDEILHSNTNNVDELLPVMVPTDQSGGLFEAVTQLLKEGSPKQCLTLIHSACVKFIGQLNSEIKKIQDEYPMVLEAQLTANHRSTAYHRLRTISSSEMLSAPFTGPGPRLQQRVEDSMTVRWVQLRRIEHRWTKLLYGFIKEESHYDTSKVTDLWDCAYYDIVHHNEELPPEALETLQRDLMRVLVPMHAWVSSAEFGITADDKIRIGVETTWRLLQKMVNDVEFMLCESRCDLQNVISTPPADGIGTGVNYSPSFATLLESTAHAHKLGVQRASSFASHGMESHSGSNTPVATNLHPRSRASKVPPELRALLRQAMRDGSDWHPQLHDTVAQITGMKTSKCVRTRVYVTSASTMHSLLNVLAFGEEVSDEDPIDRTKVADVTDLHYLSHFVIRCFEEPETATGESAPKRILGRTVATSNAEEAKKYTVEVLFSPGVLCKELRENAMCMAPLQSICKQSVCSLDGFDTFLTEILAEFGKLDVINTQQAPATITASSPRMSL